MERRYLVAAVAIVATFAGVSRGFQSLEHLSLRRARQVDSIASSKCEAARQMARLRTHLRPNNPEEAQMLAEMDVPISNMATQIAAQNIAAAQCAREQAMRAAERARRDAMQLRDKMRRSANAGIVPMSFQIDVPDDLGQQVQATAVAYASRVAAQQVRMHMAANRLQIAIASAAESAVDTGDWQNPSGDDSCCKIDSPCSCSGDHARPGQ